MNGLKMEKLSEGMIFLAVIDIMSIITLVILITKKCSLISVPNIKN